MEDPDAEETREWVDSQVATTSAFLAGCTSRARIRARFDEVGPCAAVGGASRYQQPRRHRHTLAAWHCFQLACARGWLRSFLVGSPLPPVVLSQC